MKTSPLAVMDASIIYGASRYLRRLHDDPKWEYRGNHNKADDRNLFFEFLHNLLLYKEIILDSSSVGEEVESEILTLINQINEYEGMGIIHRKDIANFEDRDLSPIMASVCRLVSETPNPDEVYRTKVPWAYQTEKHHDYHRIKYYAEERGLSDSLIPYTLFVFRGLCYSSFANHLASKGLAYSNTPTVYLASPGRLNALSHIVSGEILERNYYARNAYVELLEKLYLPKEGYSFVDFGGQLMAHEISPLTAHLFSAEPQSALNEVLKLRDSREASKVRAEWNDMLMEYSATCSIGLNATQIVRDTHIEGNLNMYIQAVPYNRFYSNSRPFYGVESTDRLWEVTQKEERNMPESKQHIEGVKVKGDIAQKSDTSTNQAIQDATVGNSIEQDISTKQSTLSAFGASATGKVAVICLLLILLGWFLYRYFSGS